MEATYTNAKFEEAWDTTIHEIFHVLGFNSDVFANFHDPATGNRYADMSSLYSNKLSELSKQIS